MNEPAVVNVAHAQVELRDVPLPKIGEHDTLIEVAAVGVCGSDVHQSDGSHSWPVNYPVVLGHEFAGVVQAVGAQVREFTSGDRVVSETAAVIDPENPLARQGFYNLDPSRQGFGYGVDGAMTRYVRVPGRCLHHVPPTLDLATAALTEPCCVAYNAVAVQSEILPGDRIVVFGPGPIGILCAAIARLRGAEVAIVGLERDKVRLGCAETYGVTAIIGDARPWAQQRDGLGADGVIDAAGVSSTFAESMAVVRPRGWITKVGWGPQPLSVSLDPLVQKNIKVQGTFSHHWAVWERVLALLASGDLDVSPICSETRPLEQWHDAFVGMREGSIIKAVLTPGTNTMDDA